MKNFLLCSFLMLSIFARAQSTPTSVPYAKTTVPGLVMEMPYNEDVASDFVLENLKKQGYKRSKVNGFYQFKDVNVGGESADLYFKVEQKGRSKDDRSVVFMLVAKGDNFYDADDQERAYRNARKMFDDFLNQAAAYKLELDIKSAEEKLKESEDDLEKLEDREKSMIRKVEELNEDIKKNKQNQEGQRKVIDENKSRLEELKSRRA